MYLVKQFPPTHQLWVAPPSGRHSWFIVGTLLTACLALFFAGTALAQTSFTFLYDFTGVNGSGSAPIGDLSMDSQGTLYGVTAPQNGRAARIYELTPPTSLAGFWTKTNLYIAYNGFPVGGKLSPVILGKSGELYGTSTSCTTAPFQFGSCAFQLVPPTAAAGAWTVNILHLFQGATQGDGSHVGYGKLAMDANGNLYGVTQSGGVSDLHHTGIVYQLTPPTTPDATWTEHILYKFQTNSFHYPQMNATLGPDGSLYGSTRDGTQNGGVIYRLAPPAVPDGAWTMSVINRTVGGEFSGGTTQLTVASSGTIYGVSTEAGGAFALTPPVVPGGAWTISRLPSNTQGGPGRELALDENGNLYGTDYMGQTVYKLSPPATPGGTWTYMLLAQFNQYQPFGRPLVDSSGKVFAATLAGGLGANCTVRQQPVGCGTVFELQ